MKFLVCKTSLAARKKARRTAIYAPGPQDVGRRAAVLSKNHIFWPKPSSVAQEVRPRGTR